MTYLAALFLGLVLWAILTINRKQPDAPRVSDPLQDIRMHMHSDAVQIAENLGLPHGMDPALMDLAEAMAQEVHDGKRSYESALLRIRETAHKWTREMRQAGVA